MAFDFKKHSTLVTKIPGARLVGLGELVHGCDKIHGQIAALALGLIQNYKSDTVLIEASVQAAEEVNQKIQPGRSQPIVLADLDSLYRVWRTPNLASLFEAMRIHNQSAKVPLELKGFDIRIPVAALATLKEALLEDSGNDKTPVEVEPFGLDIEDLRGLEDETYVQAIEGKLSSGRYLRARANVLKVIELLSHPRSTKIQLAIVALKDWIATYDCFEKNDAKGAYFARDLGMYRSVVRLEDQRRTPAPMIMIAHFFHLIYRSEKLIEPPKHLPSGPLLGTHLHPTFGGRYVHIAVGTTQGIATLYDRTPVAFHTTELSFESLGLRFGHDGLISVDEVPQSNQVATIGDLEGPGKIPSYHRAVFNLADQLDYFYLIS